MCLGVPGRIVEVNGLVATADFWGVKRQVRLELCDQDVQPGDYILNHVGYAIRRIPEEDIEGTLALYDQLLKEAGAADDLMGADVLGELGAAPLDTPLDTLRTKPLGALGTEPLDTLGAEPEKRP